MTTFHDTNALENGPKTLHDLWDKAGESNPNVLNPATYKRPTVVSRPKTPLFALLIGINLYRWEDLKPLRGAVPDVLAFKEYLETDLAVPPENITTLVNRSATRSAIIEALRRLINDTRISKGHPILIFYAGYGSETQASDSPLSADRCVIPYDYSEKQGHEIEAIGHRAIASLVSQIVETKGDNITLIFDCSYSPSSGQEADEFTTTRVRSARVKSPISPSSDLEKNVWRADENAGLGKPCSPEKLHPYIFLSACSPSEAARETHGRGNFTKAVLSLLRHSSPHELLNSDLVARIDQIPGQTPQCVGRNTSRSLFDGKVAVTQRTCFHLTNSDSQFVLHAGTIHGITSGAELTIHSSNDYSFDTPLGQLRIDSLGAFSTTLTFPLTSDPFPVPDSALAILAKVGTLEDIRFYIPFEDRLIPCYEALLELMRGGHADLENIVLVDSPRKAHIEIAEENDRAVFLIRDERITQYGLTRLCDGVELTVESIIPVLKAAAHYYWKINRTNTDTDISTNIEVEFYRLEDLSLDTDSFGASELVPSGSSLYHNNMVEFVVEEDCPYGLKLTNNGPYDLYPYMFYFDNSDLSVGAYYQPPANEEHPPPPLKKNGGTLTIGYGSGGATPFAYYLRDNQDLDVGFLKLFLATSLVDLSNIPQSTPFETSRSADRFAKSTKDTWSTILIPVVQHRFPPNSKPCPKCGHTIFDDSKATAIALKEENDELKRELDDAEADIAEEQRQIKEQREDFTRKMKSMEEELARAEKQLAAKSPSGRGSIFKVFLIKLRKARFWLPW